MIRSTVFYFAPNYLLPKIAFVIYSDKKLPLEEYHFCLLITALRLRETVLYLLLCKFLVFGWLKREIGPCDVPWGRPPFSSGLQ